MSVSSQELVEQKPKVFRGNSAFDLLANSSSDSSDDDDSNNKLLKSKRGGIYAQKLINTKKAIKKTINRCEEADSLCEIYSYLI
jgi:hypothetical protein